MARPLRIQFPGAVYHVTARGNERRAIYRDDTDRRRFLATLAEAVDQFHLLLHAYVLMGNHYHLLVETLEANLSRAMKQINGVYSQSFNRRHDRVGHLFQGRFKALLVERDSYLVELSRYIHLNPVRAGITEDAESYRWSSARAYSGRSQAPPFLTIAEVLGHFDGSPARARRAYAEFLAEPLTDSSSPLDGQVGATLLGSGDWIAAMRERIDDCINGGRLSADSREQMPALRALRRRPTPSQVIAAVADATQVPDQTIRRPFTKDRARAIAIYIAYRESGLCQAEIGSVFGVSSFGVSKSARAIARARSQDCQLDRLLERLVSSLRTRQS